MIRSRFHADFWFRDNVRLFAEFLDARTFGQSLAPLPTDVNHTDMLNLFADIKVANVKDAPAYIRFGRQELLYGSQRLISTLDWVNTRRTFQGAKAFWKTADLDLDAFWVRPMITEADRFDNWDTKREFFGLWGTYRPMKGQLVDLYFLSLLNDNQTLAFNRPGNIIGSSIYRLSAAASPATTTNSCTNWRACISLENSPTWMFQPLQWPQALATISRDSR